MRIEICETAEEQLRAIHTEYEAYSPQAAHKLMQQFYKRLKQLSQFPLSGEKIPELGYPQLRHILVGPYRVLYHVHPDSIEILAFLHTAQDWPMQPPASEEGESP